MVWASFSVENRWLVLDGSPDLSYLESYLALLRREALALLREYLSGAPPVSTLGEEDEGACHEACQGQD